MKHAVALNVAEKPSVARAIATHLSGKKEPKTRAGLSRYNPLFDFTYKIQKKLLQMVVTSVRGHVLNLQFPRRYQSWKGIDPEELYEAPLDKKPIPDCEDVLQNLKSAASTAHVLILWLDCDREGEAIAFDIIDICKEVNPKIEVLRAHFSALTKSDIERAA